MKVGVAVTLVAVTLVFCLFIVGFSCAGFRADQKLVAYSIVDIALFNKISDPVKLADAQAKAHTILDAVNTAATGAGMDATTLASLNKMLTDFLMTQGIAKDEATQLADLLIQRLVQRTVVHAP
jgi:hypothetical protein